LRSLGPQPRSGLLARLGRAGRIGPALWAGLASSLWLLAGLGCATAPPSGSDSLCLALVEEATGRVVHRWPVVRGEDFTLWFLHSYDRAFFAEHYRVQGPGRILLRRMSFKSNLNGEGFEYTDFHLRPDGVGELRNIDERRRRVEFMLGSPDLANHTLILRGRRIPLLRYLPPHTLVYLAVEECRERGRQRTHE
jgi:hypothetical protein